LRSSAYVQGRAFTHVFVPPAGFEPALSPPEGDAGTIIDTPLTRRKPALRGISGRASARIRPGHGDLSVPGGTDKRLYVARAMPKQGGRPEADTLHRLPAATRSACVRRAPRPTAETGRDSLSRSTARWATSEPHVRPAIVAEREAPGTPTGRNLAPRSKSPKRFELIGLRWNREIDHNVGMVR